VQREPFRCTLGYDTSFSTPDKLRLHAVDGRPTLRLEPALTRADAAIDQWFFFTTDCHTT
jgi:hypothetical protein